MQRVNLVLFLAILMVVAVPVLAQEKRVGEPSYPPPSNYRHQFSISETYDKFADKTDLSVSLGIVFSAPDDTLTLKVYRTFSGTKRTKGAVSFYFRNRGEDGWRYLKYHPIIFLVDGERWTFEPNHDGDVETGYVLEHLFVHLSEDQLLKIAHAKSAQVKVGCDIVYFKPEHVTALKDFASLIGDPSAPINPPSAIGLNAPVDYDYGKFLKEYNEKLKRSKADEELKNPETLAVKADARMNSAKNFDKDKNMKMAIKYYREVVRDFPGTPHSVEATKRLKELKAELPDPVIEPSKPKKK